MVWAADLRNEMDMPYPEARSAIDAQNDVGDHKGQQTHRISMCEDQAAM